MRTTILLISLISIVSFTDITSEEEPNYFNYHLQVIEAEKLIASDHFREALHVYERLFENYEFIFLREYQIATQLALYLNEIKKAEHYLRKGMLSGWQMKSIKRNKFLFKLKATKGWEPLKIQYKSLHKQYKSGLNKDLRKQVKKMFSKDQRKAIGALFTFSSKAQDRYAEKRFAPHSEKQLSKFSDILKSFGYPGENLIGNDFWMSTILSHHNSISQRYVEHDTIYPNIKNDLNIALKNGQISPFEFALIDDWYRSTINDKEKTTYGILDPPSQASLLMTNELRISVLLRPVEIRNKLVEVQHKTGIDFYLPGRPWIKGKIAIR